MFLGQSADLTMENTINCSLEYSALSLQSNHKGAGQLQKPLLLWALLIKALTSGGQLKIYDIFYLKIIIIIIEP